MTTDIARIDGNAIAVLGGANEALTRLEDWVQAAQHAHQLVVPLVRTAFVPDAYKPKIGERATDKEKEQAMAVAVGNATAAVLQGITLGLDPMTALQQIYIVHGRPGLYTEMKVALVKSKGHEVWTEDISDTRAIVCGRRAGTDYTERVIVTMDMARKAGWTSNQAYARTPQDMLYARAAGRVCDRIAPDVLMGIASVEEIQDTIQVSAQAGNGTRTVSPRKRAAAPVPAITAGVVDEPPLEEDSVAGTQDQVEPEPGLETPIAPDLAEAPIAKPKKRAQARATASDPEPAIEEPALEEPGAIPPRLMAKVQAMFSQAGLNTPEAKRGYCARVLGRPVESFAHLSVEDVRTVISELETPPAEGGEPA